MTLDEAIAQEIAFSKEDWCQRKQYHEQLAEWLEELKAYRASVFSGDMTQKMLKEEYNKAIEDFSERIKQVTYTRGTESDGYYKIHAICERDIDEIAEQLKAGDGE